MGGEASPPLTVPLGLAHVAHWLSAAALPFSASDGELVEVFSPPRGTSNAERLRPLELQPTAAGDLLQPALDAFAAKSSMVINSLHRWDATAAFDYTRGVFTANQAPMSGSKRDLAPRQTKRSLRTTWVKNSVAASYSKPGLVILPSKRV